MILYICADNTPPPIDRSFLPIVLLTPHGIDAEDFKNKAQLALKKLDFSGPKIQRIKLLCSPEPPEVIEHFKTCVDMTKKYAQEVGSLPRAFAYVCSRPFFSKHSKQLAKIIELRDAEMKKSADVLDLIVHSEKGVVGEVVTYPRPYSFLVQQCAEDSGQGSLQSARRVVYNNEAWWSGIRYSKAGIEPETILPGVQEALDIESARVD